MRLCEVNQDRHSCSQIPKKKRSSRKHGGELLCGSCQAAVDPLELVTFEYSVVPVSKYDLQ